jgi:hypothetical protein
MTYVTIKIISLPGHLCLFEMCQQFSRKTQTRVCFYTEWIMLLVGMSLLSTYSLIINPMHDLH